MNQFDEYYNPAPQENQRKSQSLGSLYGGARVKFIQKVYTILSFQLIITALVSIVSITSPKFLAFQAQNLWLMILSIIGVLVVEIYIFYCDGGRQYPKNMILLGIFTFFQAYLVGFICGATAAQSGKDIVIMAAVMTAVIVLLCTIYAFKTETDFTTSWGIIIVIGGAMLTLLILSFFVQSTFLHKLYCTLGVILFGIYLIIDTQMIMGGKRAQLTVDDYVVVAMCLYIDIIQIFLYLLKLLKKQ